MADLSRALVKLQPTLALTARRRREHLLSRRFEPHLGTPGGVRDRRKDVLGCVCLAPRCDRGAFSTMP
jgi:hypothetical protein